MSVIWNANGPIQEENTFWFADRIKLKLDIVSRMRAIIR